MLKGDETASVKDNTTFYTSVGCPYRDRCRDYDAGRCSSCRHSKESYYEPIIIHPDYPYYPVYPYYPY